MKTELFVPVLTCGHDHPEEDCTHPDGLSWGCADLGENWPVLIRGAYVAPTSSSEALFKVSAVLVWKDDDGVANQMLVANPDRVVAEKDVEIGKWFGEHFSPVSANEVPDLSEFPEPELEQAERIQHRLRMESFRNASGPSKAVQEMVLECAREDGQLLPTEAQADAERIARENRW